MNPAAKLSPGAAIHPAAPTTPPAYKRYCVPGAPQRPSRPVTSDGIRLPFGRPEGGWFPVHPESVAKKISF